MLRQSLLFLSRHRQLRQWMETSSIAEGLTRRFVAGRTLSDVLEVCKRLQEKDRLLTSLDHLGENVTTVEEAAISRGAMMEALEAIARLGLPATISIKLTQMGLDLSTDLCCEHVLALAETARRTGSRVEIDMESTEYTSRTLEIVEAIHARTGCVRAVLQSYLFRTEKDLERLNRQGIPVRLCKGAYKEPASHAFADKSDVDSNYLKLTRMLLESGTYPAIATHDPRMVEGARQAAKQSGKGPADFEFQMLYGVRRDLQTQLVEEGFRVRLYIPYGDAWYPYFMRRLAERPANVLFVVRNVLRA